MGLVSPSQSEPGQEITAAKINTPVNQLAAVVNGNIDSANIAANGVGTTELADDSVTAAKIAAGAIVEIDGWASVSDSWTYASATTITVPSDATTKYSVGDKLRLTNSTVKYFYITGVAATTLTVTGGSDYSLANTTISDVSYSKVATPLNFPQIFNWTPTLSGRFDDGDWTKTCKFNVVGKKCNFTVNLIATAAAPMGGGVAGATFTLPITAAAIPGTDGRQQVGTSVITDDSGQTWNGAVVFGTTTTGTLATWNTSANLAAVTSTAPFTWTTSDEISIMGSYDIA